MAKHPEQELCNALNGLPAKQYWPTKMQNLSPSLAELDSKAMEQAVTELPAHQWK